MSNPVYQVCIGNEAVGDQAIVGNAVSLGDGYFLSAYHVFTVYPEARIRFPDGALHSVIRSESAEARDLVLLYAGDHAGRSLDQARVTALDRWEPLTIHGWHHLTPDQLQQLPGTVDRPTGTAMLELRFAPESGLNTSEKTGQEKQESVRADLRSLSGSGLFNAEGSLVGILCEQRRAEDRPVDTVHFAPVEGWKEVLAARGFHDRLPECWQAQFDRLNAQRAGTVRTEHLTAIREALKAASAYHHRNGFVILEGEPSGGRSATIAALIDSPPGEPADPSITSLLTSSLYLFCDSDQTIEEAENILIHQLAYLMDYDAARYDALPKAQPNQPGKALQPLLAQWPHTEHKLRAERLLIFLDAVELLENPQEKLDLALDILIEPLPSDVYVIVGLGHATKRTERLRRELRERRQCLLYLNTDTNTKVKPDHIDPTGSTTNAGTSAGAVYPLHIGSREGNAVHLGAGYFLTASACLGGATRAFVTLPSKKGGVLSVKVGIYDWKGSALQEEFAQRGLALLRQMEQDKLTPTRADHATALDVWATLRARGLDFSRPRQPREHAGTPLQRSESGTESASSWELDFSAKESGALPYLVGAGVYNAAGQLVGIVTGEPKGREGQGVILSTLEGLFPPRTNADRASASTEGEGPACWVSSVPTCWSGDWWHLVAHQDVLGREPLLNDILDAINAARDQGKGGMIVLAGSAQRGKSALMARLIEMVGATSCLWLFATRGKTDLNDASETLSRQLAYLMNWTPKQYRENLQSDRDKVLQPADRVRRTLEKWVETGKPLTIFLDGLDELGKPLADLLSDLPARVVLVVSSRPAPTLRGALMRFPLLGAINLDVVKLDKDNDGLLEIEGLKSLRGEIPLEGNRIPAALHLVSPEKVRASNEAAAQQIWRNWAQDPINSNFLAAKGRGPNGLPPDLWQPLITRFGPVAGFHAAFARMKRGHAFTEQDIPEDPTSSDDGETAEV